MLKLLKVNLEGSGLARAEFDSEARILAQLQARVHPGMKVYEVVRLYVRVGCDCRCFTDIENTSDQVLCGRGSLHRRRRFALASTTVPAVHSRITWHGLVFHQRTS